MSIDTPTRPLPGLLYAQAREYQDALTDLESGAADELARYWVRAQATIRRDLDALLARVAEATAGGERLSPSWPLREARYRAALVTAQEQADLFGRTAARVVAATQERAATMAATSAASLGSAALASAQVGATFTGINPDNLRHLAGFLADDTPVADLLGSLGQDALPRLRDVLSDGIVLGRGVDRMRRDALAAVDVPRWRADTIVRTESHRVFRAASTETYAANADVLTGWTWLAALDSRTCPACVAMHGTVHPVTATLDGHPRCFPAGTLVAGPSAVAATARRYEGPGVVVRTASGKELTSTPNHPILTRGGWVPAGLLVVGDQVVSDGGNEREVALHDDDEQVPARIENVADTLIMAGGMAPVPVPVAPEDFHGDGGGSEVAVVGADLLLADGRESALQQPPLQQNLKRATRPGDGSPPGGVPLQPFTGDRLAAHGGVGGLGVGAVLVGGTFGGGQAVSGGLIPPLDPRLVQPEVDDVTTDPVAFRQSVDAHTGPVVLDQVVQVERVDLACHVYNLQTEDGWYTANGIVVHNCRCVQVPLPVGSDMALQPGTEWLAGQSPGTQRALLGPGKFDAYQRGELDLSALAHQVRDPRWGTMRREATLAEALAESARIVTSNRRATASIRRRRV